MTPSRVRNSLTTILGILVLLATWDHAVSAVQLRSGGPYGSGMMSTDGRRYVVCS